MAFDNAKARAEQPEYFTFNGNVAALTEMMPLQAEVGDTVRVYFGVGGPNIGSNFHIIGEIFDRVLPRSRAPAQRAGSLPAGRPRVGPRGARRGRRADRQRGAR